MRELYCPTPLRPGLAAGLALVPEPEQSGASGSFSPCSRPAVKPLPAEPADRGGPAERAAVELRGCACYCSMTQPTLLTTSHNPSYFQSAHLNFGKCRASWLRAFTPRPGDGSTCSTSLAAASLSRALPFADGKGCCGAAEGLEVGFQSCLQCTVSLPHLQGGAWEASSHRLCASSLGAQCSEDGGK